MVEPRQNTPDVPGRVQEPFRSALAVAADAWTAEPGDRLVSIVPSGSAARGQARPTSDIDLVLVADGLPRGLAERRRPFLEGWERARAARSLPDVSWNLVTRSTAEARAHSPLYLDTVEEGVALDEGSRDRDLEPDFRFGEVVEP